MPEEDNRTTAIIFYRHALDRMLTLDTLVEKNPNEISLALQKYNLTGQTAEFSYKSVLINEGYSVEDVKKIGHNLEKLVQEILVAHKDFSFHSHDFEIVRKLNPYYKTQQFEYFISGEISLPSLADTREFLFRTTSETHNALHLGWKDLESLKPPKVQRT